VARELLPQTNAHDHGGVDCKTSACRSCARVQRSAERAPRRTRSNASEAFQAWEEGLSAPTKLAFSSLRSMRLGKQSKPVKNGEREESALIDGALLQLSGANPSRQRPHSH
jgi:hypothetical protein